MAQWEIGAAVGSNQGQVSSSIREFILLYAHDTRVYVREGQRLIRWSEFDKKALALETLCLWAGAHGKPRVRVIYRKGSQQ